MKKTISSGNACLGFALQTIVDVVSEGAKVEALELNGREFFQDAKNYALEEKRFQEKGYSDKTGFIQGFNDSTNGHFKKVGILVVIKGDWKGSPFCHSFSLVQKDKKLNIFDINTEPKTKESLGKINEESLIIWEHIEALKEKFGFETKSYQIVFYRRRPL